VRRPVLPLAVLLVLAAVAGLSACGGGGASSAGTDPTALVKETFGAGHPIRSGVLDATLDVELDGLPSFTAPINLHLGGPFQSRPNGSLPDFALDLDLTTGARPITVGTVFTGGAGYLTIEGRAFDLGKDLYAAVREGYAKARSDASQGSTGAAGSLKALGIDPLRWLADPQSEGREDIGGTPTEHVTAAVDVDRLLQDVSVLLSRASGVASAGAAAAGALVPASLSADQRRRIADSVSSATMDVWTGEKDRTLRKLLLDVRIDVPPNLRAGAGGLKAGRITFSVTIGQLNTDQKIARPAGARPIGELRAALRQLGLLGAGSGAAGGASGTAPSSTTPPAPAAGQADYAQCLADAGEDLAKVQNCAALLSP
jgi:hypothetical protein